MTSPKEDLISTAEASRILNVPYAALLARLAVSPIQPSSGVGKVRMWKRDRLPELKALFEKPALAIAE